MGERFVSQQIWGELYHENDEAHPIKVLLDTTVKEWSPDENASDVVRILQTMNLSRQSARSVPDGNDYMLRYTFNGKQVIEKRRVEGGRLFAR